MIDDWWRRFEARFDWWRRFEKVFNQQDLTRRPKGKVELWLCNGVQELAKTVITQCIDNPLKAKLGKNRQNKPRKKIVGAEKNVKFNRCQANQWKLSKKEK